MAHNGSIDIIGLPFDKGQSKRGVDQAPAVLRQNDLSAILTKQGYEVTDHGDVALTELPDDPAHYNINLPRTIGSHMKRISDKVYDVMTKKPHTMCLNLGGDHTVAIGTTHGQLRAEADTVVVWVDAHADINSPLVSPSGHIHGMALGFLVHEMAPYMPQVAGFESIKPCLHAKDLAYIGLRDLDPAEKKVLMDFGISYFDMQKVDQLGIHHCMAGVINALNPKLQRGMHLSLDIDVLDPSLAPSTGTPVPGGLTLREAIYTIEALHQTGKLRAVDLVEINPTLGGAADVEITINTACNLLKYGLGGRAVHNVPNDYEMSKASV